MAVANYHDSYGTLPPAYLADADGRPMHSWRVLLLPFLGQQELYDAYDFTEPWDGAKNRRLLDRRPEIYAVPWSPPGSLTNYLAVVGPATVWPGAASLRIDEIGDGTTRTILAVENVGAGIHWTEPRDLEFATMNMSVADQSPAGVSSRYVPSAVVTVAGQVTALPMALPPATLRALLTANGGEEIDEDELALISDGRMRPLKE